MAQSFSAPRSRSSQSRRISRCAGRWSWRNTGCSPSAAWTWGSSHASCQTRCQLASCTPSTTMRSTPAARQRASTSWRSGSKGSKSRWVWVSISGTSGPSLSARAIAYCGAGVWSALFFLYLDIADAQLGDAALLARTAWNFPGRIDHGARLPDMMQGNFQFGLLQDGFLEGFERDRGGLAIDAVVDAVTLELGHDGTSRRWYCIRPR